MKRKLLRIGCISEILGKFQLMGGPQYRSQNILPLIVDALEKLPRLSEYAGCMGATMVSA